MQNPTPRQLEILLYIDEFIRAHGYPPTLLEIGREFGFHSSRTAGDHRDALIRKGYLTRITDRHTSRNIRLTDKLGQRTRGGDAVEYYERMETI